LKPPTRTAETKNFPVQVSGRPFEVSFVAGDGEAQSRLVLSMVDFEVSEVMGDPQIIQVMDDHDLVLVNPW